MQGFPPKFSAATKGREKTRAVRRVIQRAGGGGLGGVTVTIILYVIDIIGLPLYLWGVQVCPCIAILARLFMCIALAANYQVYMHGQTIQLSTIIHSRSYAFRKLSEHNAYRVIVVIWYHTISRCSVPIRDGIRGGLDIVTRERTEPGGYTAGHGLLRKMHQI